MSITLVGMEGGRGEVVEVGGRRGRVRPEVLVAEAPLAAAAGGVALRDELGDDRAATHVLSSSLLRLRVVWKLLPRRYNCGATETGEDAKEAGKGGGVEVAVGDGAVCRACLYRGGCGGARTGGVCRVCVECAAVESANQESGGGNGAVTRQRQRQLRLSSD